MKIEQKPAFQKAYKKLHPNQRADVNQALHEIIDDPLIGVPKKGDLADIRVYKFRMVNQLTLIAYTYEEDILVLTFVAIGSHENFYRDIKR